MIYYIILSYVILNGTARGTVTLTTTDDLRDEIFELEFETESDANLDLLTVTIDPNVIPPTSVTTVAQASLEYNVTKSVVDTIELNSLLTLINNLT